jgi:ribosomal-protein-alanine N-acetyltransferase
VKLLQKYVLRRVPVAVSGSSGSPAPASLEAFPEVMIRPARKEDLTAAAEMERSSFTAFAMSRRQLQYHQQRESSIFLVAEQGNRVVGDGIALVRSHRSGISGRIYSLVVRGDCRGQKIGAKLLSAMLEELSTRGVRRTYLEVEDGNDAALRLYDRFGFRRIGTLDDYYAPGRSAIHMMYESDAVEADQTLFPLRATKRDKARHV